MILKAKKLNMNTKPKTLQTFELKQHPYNPITPKKG